MHLSSCRSNWVFVEMISLLDGLAIFVDYQLTVRLGLWILHSVARICLCPQSYVLITVALGGALNHSVSSLAPIFSKVILTVQLCISVCASTPARVKLSTYVLLDCVGIWIGITLNLLG